MAERGGGPHHGPCEESLRDFDRAMAGFRHAITQAPREVDGAPAASRPTTAIGGTEVATMDALRTLDRSVALRLAAIEQKVDRALATYDSQLGVASAELKTIQSALERLEWGVDEITKRHEETQKRIAEFKGGASMNHRLKQGGLGDRLCTAQEMSRHADLIQAIWTEKKDNILGELCHNLRCPGKGDGSSEPLTPVHVAEICQSLHRNPRYGGSDTTPVVMQDAFLRLCRVLYTMTDVDMDRLLGFQCEELPPNMEDPRSRDNFYKAYRRSVTDLQGVSTRNPEMFREACSAMRKSFGNHVEEDEQISKWVKWICIFGAVTCKHNPPLEVFRGLTNLPDSLINDLVDKKKGDIIYWPAPSSTTDDPNVSRNYCMQAGSVSNNVIFNLSNVHEAIPMTQYSQYPKESEYLLPPFSKLAVSEVRRPDGGCIELDCVYKGCMLDATFRRACEEDLASASKQLVEAAQKEEMEKERLKKDIRSGHGLKGMGRDIYDEIKDDIERDLRVELDALKARLRKAAGDEEGQRAYSPRHARPARRAVTFSG